MNHETPILLIIPNLDFGGAQESFSKLSTALSKRYKIINVVFNTNRMANYTLGGDLISLDIPQSRTWLGKLFRFFQRVRKLRSIKNEHNISIAISFLEGADYVNVLSRNEEKLIISVRGSKRFDQNIKGFIGFCRHKILIPYFYNRADLIVTLSQGVQGELREFYSIRRNMLVLYNEYNLEVINSKSREQLDDNERNIFTSPVIVSHGRFALEKGFHYLIEIFSHSNKKGKYRLLLIGDGLEKESLMTQCEDLRIPYCDLSVGCDPNIDYKIYFLGYSQNPFKYLANAYCFVSTSLHEGFGNSIVEAMACGLPVLAADSPYGAREILVKDFDHNKEIVYPYFGDYGMLLPDLNYIDGRKFWANNLEKILSGDLEQYRRLSVKRATDFDGSKNFDGWISAIEEL